MTPEYIRFLRLNAAFVQERLDKALQMDTPQRRKDFEDVEEWFKDKYPHYNWRDWIEKKKERGI